MSYTYYFRCDPEASPIPEGYTKIDVNRVVRWNHRLQCWVMGFAEYPRPLSAEDLEQYDLIPDPRNHLAAVRKE